MKENAHQSCGLYKTFLNLPGVVKYKGTSLLQGKTVAMFHFPFLFVLLQGESNI